MKKKIDPYQNRSWTKSISKRRSWTFSQGYIPWFKPRKTAKEKHFSMSLQKYGLKSWWIKFNSTGIVFPKRKASPWDYISMLFMIKRLQEHVRIFIFIQDLCGWQLDQQKPGFYGSVFSRQNSSSMKGNYTKLMGDF